MPKGLKELFPAFLEIKDDELREKSMSALKLAMEKGGWDEESIVTCPVTLNWEKCDVSLVEHVNDVVTLCMAEFKLLEKYYKRRNVPFCRDLVIAGALLHDIGKLTEFVPIESGGAAHGDNYELMRHPLSGALIASQAGLPDEIVHLIAVHSFEGDRSYQTPESSFVRSIDIFAFNNAVIGLKKL